MARRFQLSLVLILSAPVAFSGIGAAHAAADDPDAFARLRECRDLAADAERLACFDRVSAQVLAAADKGELKVVDREEIRDTRRRLFGFSVPDTGVFAKDAHEQNAADEQILRTTIASARRTARNGWLITTAEDAVWQIDNPPRRLLNPKAGQPIEFRKGALGSYFIGIDGQKGVKGKRVQ